MSLAAVRQIYQRSLWLLVPRACAVLFVVTLGASIIGWLAQDPAFSAVYSIVAGTLICARVTRERRRLRRKTFRRTVSCTALGCADILTSMTLDMTERGFFVQTSSPYPLLTRFRFELDLLEGEEPVCGYGVVRWVNHHPPWGMGIEIVGMEDPGRFHALYAESERYEGWEGIQRFFHRYTY